MRTEPSRRSAPPPPESAERSRGRCGGRQRATTSSWPWGILPPRPSTPPPVRHDALVARIKTRPLDAWIARGRRYGGGGLGGAGTPYATLRTFFFYSFSFLCSFFLFLGRGRPGPRPKGSLARAQSCLATVAKPATMYDSDRGPRTAHPRKCDPETVSFFFSFSYCTSACSGDGTRSSKFVGATLERGKMHLALRSSSDGKIQIQEK